MLVHNNVSQNTISFSDYASNNTVTGNAVVSEELYFAHRAYAKKMRRLPVREILTAFRGARSHTGANRNVVKDNHATYYLGLENGAQPKQAGGGGGGANLTAAGRGRRGRAEANDNTIVNNSASDIYADDYANGDVVTGNRVDDELEVNRGALPTHDDCRGAVQGTMRAACGGGRDKAGRTFAPAVRGGSCPRF